MKTIPGTITDAGTVTRLNQINHACELIRERRRNLAKIIQAGSHTKDEFSEYRELSNKLAQLEKAWDQLSPSRMDSALQKAFSKV